MKKLNLLITLSCLSVILAAQQESFTIFDTVQLEEIRITASVPLNERTLLDFHRSANYSSIDKINERLNGIMMIRRGAYAMDPQMHGFAAGQINVTIDGMRMFGACTDRMDPITSYLEPENLKTLRINHGTAGNIMGNTTGGSYDMILVEPQAGTRRFSVMAGTGLETVSRGINSNAAFELGRERWAWRINGTYRKNHNYTGGDGRTVPYSQYEKYNVHSVLKYELPERAHFRFDLLLDEAYDVGYTALPMDVARARARMYSAEYLNKFENTSIQKFRARVYYNSVYHLMDDSGRDSLFFLEGPTDSVYMRMDMPGWSNTGGFFTESELRVGARGVLRLKIDDYLNYSRANMTMFMNSPANPGEPPMFAETWPEQYRNVLGAYAGYTGFLSDVWKIGINTRLDYSVTKVIAETGWRQFSIFGYDITKAYSHFPLSLNIDLGLRPGSAVSVDGGIGFAQRLPTNSEQFGFFLYNALDGYDYLGNPEIRPESNLGAWLKLRYTNPTLKLSLNGSYNHVNQYIIGMIDGSIPQMNLYAEGLKRYRNIDYARILGAGFQIQLNPGGGWQIYSLSKYTHGRTYEGDALPLIPPLKNISIVKFAKRDLSAQVEAEFSSAQNRISKTFGEGTTKGYSVFHTRLGWILPLSGISLEVSAGIENMFDRAYSEHLDWGDYLRPGRNFYMNLNFML